MNIFSLVLCLLGIIVFIAVYFGVQRRWAVVALGLAFVWLGLVLQLLIKTPHLITINWN